MSPLPRFLNRRRRALQMSMDWLVWVVVVPTAAWLRYDFDASQLRLGRDAVYVALVLALQAAVGAVEGLYLGRYSFGSFEEVAALTRTVVIVTLTAGALSSIGGQGADLVDT